MMRSMLGVPLRVGLRATGMVLGAAVGVAEEALAVAGRLADLLVGRGEPEAAFEEPEAGFGEAESDHDEPEIEYDELEVEPPPNPPLTPQATPLRKPPPKPRKPPPTPPPEAPAPPEPAVPELQEPRHVSEEASLVESVAEPGAEDGPGAEIHVAAPWEGYRLMTAADVIDRLTHASPAELAAVRLYEQGGRRRRTVLAAVERELARRG